MDANWMGFPTLGVMTCQLGAKVLRPWKSLGFRDAAVMLWGFKHVGDNRGIGEAWHQCFRAAKAKKEFASGLAASVAPGV